MSDVVKFSEASSIAMHAMAILAGAEGRQLSVREVASRLPISSNHLAKVLQRLSRAGLVESTRGPGGGFRLRGDPGDITLLEVHEAVEGPADGGCCLMSKPDTCEACILGDALVKARAIIRSHLAGTRLAGVSQLLGDAPALVARRRAPGRRR